MDLRKWHPREPDTSGSHCQSDNPTICIRQLHMSSEEVPTALVAQTVRCIGPGARTFFFWSIHTMLFPNHALSMVPPFNVHFHNLDLVSSLQKYSSQSGLVCHVDGWEGMHFWKVPAQFSLPCSVPSPWSLLPPVALKGFSGLLKTDHCWSTIKL